MRNLNNLKPKVMNEQKKNILRIVLQTLISVISAVATALGLQSCM